MKRNIRVKPGKPQLVIGMIVGIVFTIIGLTYFSRIFGAFGILWSLVAAGIAIYNGYMLFSNKGPAMYEIDMNDGSKENNEELDFDEKLRKLEKLKNEGLITQSEYEEKRQKIMDEEW